MPSIGQITRQVIREAHVDLGEGDVVVVKFDRNKITPAWIQESEQREKSDSQSLPKGLAEVILDWDVTDNDGSPYPPTAENLARLSYPVQAEILGAMVKAAVPSRAEGNDSSEPASTPSTDSSGLAETSPNGQETLPSPAPSVSQSPT